jgi:hypothetical protein
MHNIALPTDLKVLHNVENQSLDTLIMKMVIWASESDKAS